jgi:hypothetical protein
MDWARNLLNTKRIRSKSTHKTLQRYRPIFAQLKQKLIVTKGAEGVRFFENNKEVTILASKVEAIDDEDVGLLKNKNYNIPHTL